MTITDIISRNYNKLYKLLPNIDSEVHDGLCFDDIFHNVLISAIKKYKKEDLEEEIGYELVKKMLLTEILFSKGRKVANWLYWLMCLLKRLL